MTIAAVGTGSPPYKGSFADTNGFSLTPVGVGNFILLTVTSLTTANWATAISNAGNVTWNVGIGATVLSNNAVTQVLFLGQVNSTAAQAQTISFNTGSPGIRVGWQEFSTTAGFAFVTGDGNGTVDVASSGHFPAVTPGQSGDTYWSFIYDNSTGAAGTTSGYTYTVDGVHGNLQCYNTSCTSATQTPNIGNTDGTAGIGITVYDTASGNITAHPAVATATGTAYNPSVTVNSGIAASAGLASATGAALAPLPSIVRGNNGFPYHRLGLKVELLVNTTWTDITSYTYVRNPVSISPFGRTNETSSMQSAQMTLTLNNRSGRFTPGNSSGAYYPYVQLNAQIRVSVNDTSINGTAYSGYRFWGEVSSWPAAWDRSGRDVYADITASGIWRRLSQSTKRLGSPYTRYNNINVRNAWTLASYWPMEDGPNSTTLANLVTTQAAMTIVTHTPTLAADTNFAGSDAIPVLNSAQLSGVISTSASPANVLWRFNMFVPGGGDTGSGGGPIARMHCAGTLGYVDVNMGRNATGPLTISGYNTSGTLVFTGSSTLTIWGVTLLVQVGLAQVGGNIVWSLRTMLPGATTANSTVTGSLAGTVSDSTSVIFAPGSDYFGTAVGQCVVIYGNPNIVDASGALSGWSGEYAGARFQRLCTEQGIANTLVGSGVSGTAMGPQADDTLANVLQSIEATDGGVLFETRSQFGLGYRTQASMQNQSPALPLNYAAQQMFEPLTPVNDDQLVRNDVTLTNYDGYAVRAYLATGARSIQAPPSGVGNGYEYTASVSGSSHTQVAALATQLLNRGTVADNRYPTVTVNLARVTTANLFTAVPTAGIGDYLQMTNMPAYSGAATQKQLIWGWAETLSQYTWTFVFNTIPEAPWESGYVPGTSVSGQVPGTPTTLSQASSVSGAQIAESAITLFSLAQEVLTYQFGGITSNINSVAPSNPKAGDLWFDASNGYQIKRWDAVGGSWVLVTFNGSNILGAGTITAGLIAANAVIAGNIAAGAVTATQLAAGIVKAGIVNGTLISGAQFVAYGSSGEILVYSGAPATGNLIMSVSAMAGTDAQANAYKAGVWIYDTGGNSVGLVPGGGGGASQLAMSTGAGTPAAVAGLTALYGAGSGALQVIDGADAEPYGTQRRTIMFGSNQTVSSSTFANVHNPTSVAAGAAGARSYRIHGTCMISPNQASGQMAIQVAASGFTPTNATSRVNYWWGANGTQPANQAIAVQITISPNSLPGPSFNPGFTMSTGALYVVTFDGICTVPASSSGSLVVQFAVPGGTGSTSFAVLAGSFVEYMPV